MQPPILSKRYYGAFSMTTVFTAGDRTPFTYLIKCIPTGELYYGVRYAKGCLPSDLWTTYFTSSKKIAQRIQVFGSEAFEVSVRRIFDCPHKSRIWEHTVLRRLNVLSKPSWLNISNGLPFAHRIPGSQGKKLVYIFADNTYKYFDKEIVQALVQNNLGEIKGPPKPPEHGKRISARLKGRRKSDEHLANIKVSQKTNPKNRGYSIYNNGQKDLRVFPGDTIPEGYYPGVVTQKASIPNKHKGKTYEQIYGHTRSKELKDKKSQLLKLNNPGTKMKYKTYEELYGEERANELKLKRSENGKKNGKEYIIYKHESILFCGARLEAESFLGKIFGRKPGNLLYNNDLLTHHSIKVETRYKHR